MKHSIEENKHTWTGTLINTERAEIGTVNIDVVISTQTCCICTKSMQDVLAWPVVWQSTSNNICISSALTNNKLISTRYSLPNYGVYLQKQKRMEGLLHLHIRKD